MEPNDIQLILRQVLGDGISINVLSYIFVFLLSAVGAYLAAYFRIKGEHLATKEDFADLLAQQRAITQEVERIKNEFYITKATYDKHIQVIFDYYANIYRYYRLCQKAASSSHVRKPGEPWETTKSIFEDKLDDIVLQHQTLSGYVRLLLPPDVLEICSRLTDAFNDFKNLIKELPEDATSLPKRQEAFKLINDKKSELETSLRKFLRVDQLSIPSIEFER